MAPVSENRGNEEGRETERGEGGKVEENERGRRGKEILNINEIKESKENSFVIVAISKKNYTAVTETLNSLGYQNVFWISL